MSDAPDRDEKTERPSDKRKQDAARDGDTLQSRELATALVMAGGAAWLVIAGRWLFGEMREMLRQGLIFGASEAHDAHPASRFEILGTMIAMPLGLLMLATLVCAVSAPALLGSLGFRPAAFVPKPSKLNPVKGLSRILGFQGLTELGKAIVKVIVLASIAWWSMTHYFNALMALGGYDVERSAGAVGDIFVRTAIAMIGGLCLVGLVDAPIQWMQRQARLRMTKQETRQEAKDAQGSPEIKARLSRHRHDLLNGSARKAVTEATVVLVNPVQFAVALRYRPQIDAAPVVVARGRGETALAIRSLSTAHDVPLLEYPQLARAIYFTTRAGQTVAPDLYVAVATILAFVFNLARGLAEENRLPVVAVPVAKRFDAEGRRAS